uniref:2Fe-2S ferredoxin-type domain-containing protein n=1 Tax=Eucampia antarctica TaxID=49252 RepID=A0A7S2SLY0_9STRA|mmetsp:Transcript_9783/g.9442  ORF Transcript_9783/g.9442 Transcript_9783/m.9442 type:complete len:115 (+) Transcript_9783:96-440(+)
MNTCSSFAVLLLAFACVLSVGTAFFVNDPTFARSATQLQMTKLTYNGKAIEFKEGSPMKSACAKLGMKPRYSCKKGDCASCTISVGGTRIKPCVGKVPPAPRLKSLQAKGLPCK